MSIVHQETSRRRFVSGLVAAAAATYAPVTASAQQETPSSGQTSAPAALEQLAPGLPAPAHRTVIDVTRSRFAKLHGVPVDAVVLDDGFWYKRRQVNVNTSIPTLRDEMEQHGRMDNFRRLSGENHAPRLGRRPCDADVYKWIEAVSFTLQSGQQPELQEYTKKLIYSIKGAQEPSGYLNTYYVGEHAAERMTLDAQEVGHETYCIGHLLQAGIAYYRATGDPTLLDVGRRFIDQYLIPRFGPESDKKPLISGHPELEMALVEVYRTTGQPQYLKLAEYLLRGDPRIPVTAADTERMFCGIPFTTRTKLQGHAVRAMYACCGATDVYLETGDRAYLTALDSLWSDLVRHKMYITAGVGSVIQGETFGSAYELPNGRAYAETCAAIGNMMWNWRMAQFTADSRYIDVAEDALYNGINSGMSVGGNLYLYRNPLAYDPASDDQVRNVRSPWYDTTCCPPNIERTFASLPGYFYSTSPDGIYIHLFHASTLNWHLEDGKPIQIVQKTEYPWKGDVNIGINPAAASEFTVFLRIPAWATGAKVMVNGNEMPNVKSGQYLAIRRGWKRGDTVVLRMPMDTRVVTADPRVLADNSKVAVQRGPMLYCLEGIDQPKGAVLDDLRVSSNGSFEPEYVPDLFEGVVRIKHSGAVAVLPEDAPLYSRANRQGYQTQACSLTFIPYFTWGNRDRSAMQVWTLANRA